jgi:hypothetical protein
MNVAFYLVSDGTALQGGMKIKFMDQNNHIFTLPLFIYSVDFPFPPSTPRILS